MPTTAISFRRGTHQENTEFAGVPGEIVADLGDQSEASRTNNPLATIVLHTGSDELSGIRMAREDMLNITEDGINQLASIGLARNDLSNVTSIRNNTLINLLADIGVAKSNGTNITTKNLAPIINNVPTQTTIKNPNTNALNEDAEVYPALLRNDFTNLLPAARDQFAAKNMSNVDTANLATSQSGHAGNNLAYANGTNISTSDLASSSRTLGGALAYRDLSNITATEIKNKIDFDNTISNYQLKSEKVDQITSANTDTIHYPSTLAIVNYMGQGTAGADRRLSNILTWENASKKLTEYSYLVVIDNEDDSTTHTIGEVISTTIGGLNMTFTVSGVSNGKITDVLVSPQQSTVNITPSSTNNPYTTSTGTRFTVNSISIIVGKLMLADLSNSEVEAYDANTNYSTVSALQYDVDYDSAQTPIRVNEVSMNIASETQQGIVSAELKDDNTAQTNISVIGYHMNNDNMIIDGYSGLFIHGGKVYANRNEYTTSGGERLPVMDVNHEVVIKSDIAAITPPTTDGVYHLVVQNGVASWVADSNLVYVP